jgi:hypothetical protein
MMPSPSIKRWRFVYRSRRLKRFHKCCNHRFAAGRIRPLCGPARLAVAWRRRVAGSTAALLFYTGKTAHRALATAAIDSKLRIQNAACPSVFGLRVLLDKISDRGRGHRSGLTRHFETISEQRHGRDRCDTKTSGQTGNLFGVYLCQNELTGRFLCHFPELRRNHFARTAPRRPEID